jgi:hypothetical protein
MFGKTALSSDQLVLINFICIGLFLLVFSVSLLSGTSIGNDWFALVIESSQFCHPRFFTFDFDYNLK